MNKDMPASLGNEKLRQYKRAPNARGRPRKDVPAVVRRIIGSNIRHALEQEHLRYCKGKAEQPQFSYLRFCNFSEIPYATVTAWVRATRNVDVFDLLEVARFTKSSFESLLRGVPSVAEMRELALVERSGQMAVSLAERMGNEGGLFQKNLIDELDALTKYFPADIRQMAFEKAGLEDPEKSGEPS